MRSGVFHNKSKFGGTELHTELKGQQNVDIIYVSFIFCTPRISVTQKWTPLHFSSMWLKWRRYTSSLSRWCSQHISVCPLSFCLPTCKILGAALDGSCLSANKPLYLH